MKESIEKITQFFLK